MAGHPVIVSPPDKTGGRRIQIDDQTLGTAHSLHDLRVFLNRVGMEDWDEVYVAESLLIEWRGGGPEVWSPRP